MDSNNNMCYYHPDEILKYICSNCNKLPVCSDCYMDGELHSGHKVIKVTTNHIIDMVVDLKKQVSKDNVIVDNLYKSIDNLVLDNKSIIDKCKTKVDQSEIEKNKNLKLIKDQFKLIHQFISITEFDLEKQIIKNHDRNVGIQSSILSIITNENTTLEQVLVNNSNNSNNETTTTIKDYQHSTIILNNNNKKDTIEKTELLNQFNNKTITFKQDKIDLLKQSLNQLYSFNDTYNGNNNSLSLNENSNNNNNINNSVKNEQDKVVESNNEKKDQLNPINGNGLNIQGLSINGNGTTATLKNFNEELTPDILPNTITSLKIENILHPLKAGSIPSTVKYLYLYGFNHGLNRDIIPNNITHLYFTSIKYPLKVGSIPSTVIYVHLLSGFNHELEPGILPHALQSLLIDNIEYPLKVGSIPPTVQWLYLSGGFSHELKSGIIPEGVKTLIIGDIKYPLKAESIPSTVKEISLLEQYNHHFDQSLLPSDVKVIKV